jgi:HSP20 family protein
VSRTPKKRSVDEGRVSGAAVSRSRVVVLDAGGDLGFHPPADIHETADAVMIRMELPGVPVSAIQVAIQGDRIEVAGQKVRDRCGPDASYLCLERSFGRYHRAFELSGCLNMSLVTAVVQGGVLRLTIPKCEERRGRRRWVPVTGVPDREEE